MVLFPGTALRDLRFIDKAGNVAELWAVDPDKGVVVGLCLTEGKVFLMGLDRWNETYTSIMSLAFKQGRAKERTEERK